jgi:hypothetical protein
VTVIVAREALLSYAGNIRHAATAASIGDTAVLASQSGLKQPAATSTDLTLKGAKFADLPNYFSSSRQSGRGVAPSIAA